MRAPTQARPEFADGPRRPFRWTRLPWAVSFLVFSALTWWATYHHHAVLGVGVLIIIILVSLSVHSLYRAAEGNARVVSAFAGIVVLSMALAVIQKAPPRHPGEVLTQKWAPCPASRSPMAGRAPDAADDPEPVSAGLALRTGPRTSTASLLPTARPTSPARNLTASLSPGEPAPAGPCGWSRASSPHSSRRSSPTSSSSPSPRSATPSTVSTRCVTPGRVPARHQVRFMCSWS